MTTTTTETISQSIPISKHTMQSSESTTTTTMLASRKLKLLSPVGAEPHEFEWPLVHSNKSNAATEIFETMKFVTEEFEELKFAIERNVLPDFDPNSYETMKTLCDKYNKVIKDTLQMYKGTSIQKRSSKARPSTELLHHIVQLCYNNSVGDPQRLNKFYEPFSPEVYGETSFKFIQQMIEDFHFNEDDVFIDLGSGVGQVVLHVAAATKCNRCIGIEKADLPSRYAVKMERKFRFWMNWFGKECTDFELHKGDFFSGEFTELIQSASFIFVNNFAFGPEVDHRLKSVFENLRDGARILSSKAFCALNFRISNRNLNDIGALMKVKEILPNDIQSVSWTGKPVSYFLHTMDRRELEKYFASQNKRTHKNSDKKAANRSSSKKYNQENSSLNASDSCPEQDEKLPPKWTRNKWNEFHNNHYSNTTTANHQTHTAETKGNHILNGIVDKANHSPEKRNMMAITEQSVKKKNSRGRPRKNPFAEKVAVATAIGVKKEALPDDNSNHSTVEFNVKIETFDHPEEQQHEEAESVLRRRGRPRKVAKKVAIKRSSKVKGVCLSNLELLHQKTVLSIDSGIDRRRPPPGCVDQKLCSKSNALGVPHVVVTNEELNATDGQNIPLLSPGSEYSTPTVNNPNGVKVYENLKQFDDLCLIIMHSFYQFQQYTKTAEYRQTLLDKIKNAEILRNELRCKENEVKLKIFEDKHSAFSLAKGLLGKLQVHSYMDLVTKFNDEVTKKSTQTSEIIEKKKAIRVLEQENDKLEAQLKVANEHRRQQEEQQRQQQAEANARAAAAAEVERIKAAEVAAAAALAAATAAVQNGFDMSPMRREPNHSPKPNYKELKFKKYLSNQESASNQTFRARNKLQNAELQNQVSNDSSENSLPMANRHNDGSFKVNGDSIASMFNGGDRMPQNNLNRFEQLIHQTFMSENQSNVISHSMTSSHQHPSMQVNSNAVYPLTNGHSTVALSSVKAFEPKTTQRRTRKARVETIRTKKDRQVIVTNSAGCPTMQLVRNPPPSAAIKEANINSIIETVVNNCTKLETEKPAIKIKINAKNNTSVLVNPVDEPEYSSTAIVNKRKLVNEDSHSMKRRGSEKKETKAMENGAEPKLPPVVLKLSSINSNTNGPNYELKNVDNSESISVPPKKSSYRATQSEASKVSTSSHTAKQSDYNVSPSYVPVVPPLKLSTAQHFRSNPGNEESHLNQSKETTQSPSMSFASSRSSSVDSTTTNNTAVAAKKSRKTRSSSRKAAANALPVNDYPAAPAEGLMYQSQQNGLAAAQLPQPPPPASENFLSNYPNFMNIGDSAKNIFNNNHPYFANGMSQHNFDTAHFWNRNIKATTEPQMVHHRKMKDHSKANHYYDEGNSSSSTSIHQYQQYHRQLSSCMMDKGGGGGGNPPESLNHNAASASFDYSSINGCRGYDNSTATNYMPNAPNHIVTNNLDPLLKKPKNDSQVGNAHTNGYYNQNAIF